jgi:hypothetical protein
MCLLLDDGRPVLLDWRSSPGAADSDERSRRS